MDNDKIYIIVPVYKVEPYLERCVESILKQTYTNWELVLVDDGSPDNCPAICDRYAAEHGNITVIHQDNGGVSAARNAGIEYALKHGDLENNWINFIDSDDFVHPCYLEYLYRAAVEAGVAISSCGYVRTSTKEVDSMIPYVLKYKCVSPETYLCQNFTNAIVAWGKLYRLELFRKIRYPVGKSYEDNATTYYLLFHQHSTAIVSLSLYYWYTNPHSITRSAWSPQQLDAIEALEGQLVFFKSNNYPLAFKASVKELYRHCVKQSISIRLVSPKYDNITPTVKANRKKAYTLMIQEYGIFSTFGYWIYIRIIKSIIRRLKKLFCH